MENPFEAYCETSKLFKYQIDFFIFIKKKIPILFRNI